MKLMATALLALGLSACDPIVTSRIPVPKTTPTRLTLTGLATIGDSLETGAIYPVSGILSSDSILTLLEYSLWRGDAPALSEHGIRLLWNGIKSGHTEWNLRTQDDLRIVVDPAAQEGVYTLEIKATAGDTVITFPLNFTLFKLYEPKTAATVVGIWRATLVVTATEPPTVVLLNAQIDAGGTMVMFQQVDTGRVSPSYFTIAREISDWRVEAGEFRAQKTSCQYHDPVTFNPIAESACRTPLESRSDIVVSHGVWTFADNGDTTVLVRD